MKLTSLTSVICAACWGSTFSSVRAAYSPANPPPAMTTRQDIGADHTRLPRARTGDCSAAAVLEQRPGGEVARSAGDRSAGMGPGAGQVQALDAAEAPCAEAALEQLAREHLAVEDVPAGDPEAGLELARAESQAVDDVVGEARADLREAGDGRVGRRLGVDVGREALAEQGQDVAALGGQGGVRRRLAGRLDPRPGGGPPGAGVRG